MVAAVAMVRITSFRHARFTLSRVFLHAFDTILLIAEGAFAISPVVAWPQSRQNFALPGRLARHFRQVSFPG